jgi:hypothetical protein
MLRAQAMFFRSQVSSSHAEDLELDTLPKLPRVLKSQCPGIFTMQNSIYGRLLRIEAHAGNSWRPI